MAGKRLCDDAEWLRYDSVDFGDGYDSLVARAAVDDAFAGQTVEFSSTGSGNTLTQPAAVTDAAGQATGTIASTTAETKTVTVTVNPGGTPVVLSCTGASMPSGTQDRVERADEIIGLALEKGLPEESLHVDPLVIPIGVDPMAGQAYLDAVSTIRERFGDRMHIIGGVSNIRFGLPARRIITDTFLDMCVEAGQDSGIIDPVADLQAALDPDRGSEPYQLARAMLTGEDAFGMGFIEAFRAAELS